MDDELLRMMGCVSNCEGCAQRGCDYTCPNNPEVYRRRLADVNGLDAFSISTTLSPDAVGIPEYLPLIYHGYSRERVLDTDFVAIPLFKVLRHLDRQTYGCRFRSPAELREFFKIRQSANVILVGVAVDRQLEWFWSKHRRCSIPELLNQLGCVGVTVPNFSFFSDAPRYHILYNRKRILLSMERLSSAGVAIMPHLNALTDQDWSFWLEFLRDHEEISVVVKELQTGNRRREAGDRSLQKMIDLQQNLGRALHPLFVGGGRYFQVAKSNFPSFSIIDSQPFLQALSRRELACTNDRWRFQDRPLPPGTPVDELLNINIRNYPAKLGELHDGSAHTPDAHSGAFTFEFFNSIPNLTPHPLAPGVS
jgi:hypothetical protein